MTFNFSALSPLVNYAPHFEDDLPPILSIAAEEDKQYSTDNYIEYVDLPDVLDREGDDISLSIVN